MQAKMETNFEDTDRTNKISVATSSQFSKFVEYVYINDKNDLV